MDAEKENYHRLLCLVVDVGTDVLLKLLKNYIPRGCSLETFLKNKSAKIKSLKKVLTGMQMDIINSADENRFDISLLYVLISNLTNIQAPINGWGAPWPLPTDRSAGAFLVQLKGVRNEAVAHRSKAALSQGEFEKFWKEAEDALIELADTIGTSEKAAVQQNVNDTKTKRLIGNEDTKLDALLKWDFEDSYLKIASKLDAIQEQVNSHGSMTEDISTMKNSIQEIQEDMKRLRVQDVPDSPSVLVEGSHTVTDGGKPLGQNSDIEAIKLQVNKMMSMLQNFMYQHPYMNRQMSVPMGPVALELPRINNPNALTDDEILEYSRELGGDWEIFAIYLGYKQAQVDNLKGCYRGQIETLLKVLIEKWHEVVARCENENPRWLLAAAFSGIRDNLTASKVLGSRSLLNEVKKLKPKEETANKIKRITFQMCTPMMFNHGGHNSVNVFPGACMSVAGNVNMPYYPDVANASGYRSHPNQYGPPRPQVFPPTQPNMFQDVANAPGYRSHPNQYGPPQPQALRPTQPNICRAEIGDHVDGAEKKNDTSQFKKTRDETLPQIVVDILNRYMYSVGCLVNPFMKGTAFRVGDRFIITAMHVIEKVTNEMYYQNMPTTDPNNVIPMVYLNFNECMDHPSQVLYRLHPPCFTDRGLDVAILEIANPNSWLPQRLPLSKTDGPKSRVSCIGYGHPGSNSKHLDPNCPVLTANCERVMEAINRVVLEIDEIRRKLKDPDVVNSAFIGYDDASRFLLDSFFEHGGSGGPAIDHEIPPSTKVVGIYVKGFPGFFFDLPMDLQNKYRKDCRFEMCTRTSSLYSVLLSYNEEFANHIFG